MQLKQLLDALRRAKKVADTWHKMPVFGCAHLHATLGEVRVSGTDGGVAQEIRIPQLDVDST